MQCSATVNTTTSLTNYSTRDTQTSRLVLEIVWISLAVFGFVLNTAQIFWILSHHKKSVMDVFIVSLSIVDLQTCCLTIPFHVTELFHNFDWTKLGSHAHLACQFHWYFRHSSMVSGAVTISLIAVSRYIAVSHPMMKIRANKICVNSALAISTWVGTVALVAPLASATATIQTVTVNSSNVGNESTICTLTTKRCTHLQNHLAPLLYGSIVFFIVPVAVMSVSYVSLIRILVKRKQSDMLMYKGSNKHFKKSIVNSVLGLTYIILVAPQGMYDIIMMKRYLNKEESTEDEKFTELIVYMIATAVVVSNPIIYSFLTSRFFKFVEQHSTIHHGEHHRASQHSICSRGGRRFSISLHPVQLLCSPKRFKRDYLRQETNKTLVSIETEVYTSDESCTVVAENEDSKLCDDSDSIETASVGRTSFATV